MATPPTSRQVKCPRCGKTTLYSQDNRWRPFCSEHCYTLDLGAWASENYRISEKGDPDSPQQEEP
ncbi:DNA gyrase inhibitor YacG [Saezia sanguinis]|uniref:DNA gyrase inhibitor YacG n=1 Tax=Saezia sanguinis TaxID=1965230 RepID=UPI0030DD8726